MFPIANNKLFKWLFSRVLASHHGGLGAIPGRDISVLFRMKMTLVKSLHDTINKLYKEEENINELWLKNISQHYRRGMRC
jgi:hypothetical protein